MVTVSTVIPHACVIHLVMYSMFATCTFSLKGFLYPCQGIAFCLLPPEIFFFICTLISSQIICQSISLHANGRQTPTLFNPVGHCLDIIPGLLLDCIHFCLWTAASYTKNVIHDGTIRLLLYIYLGHNQNLK